MFYPQMLLVKRSGLKRSAYFPIQCHRLHYDRWVLFWFFWCNFTVAEPLLENQLTHMQGLTVIHSDVFCPLFRRDISLSLVTTKKKWQITGFCQSTYQSVGFLEVSTRGMPRHITGWHCFHFMLSWTPSAGSTGFVFFQAESTWKGRSFKRAEGFSKVCPSAEAWILGKKIIQTPLSVVGGKTWEPSDGIL